MSESERDRIRLAEAMGWSTVRHTKEWHGNTWEGVKSGEHSWRLPDPFTDANDDYAVLEWMREQSWYPEKLPQYCFDRPLHSYGVGDYARAALKVLDNE